MKPSKRNQDRLAAKAAKKAKGPPPVSKYAKKHPRPEPQTSAE